jgi:DNA-binding NtrC family response regulator
MAQVLVVDDEMGIRELLSEILTDEGHEVMLAENAAAARKQRAEGRPDLVLLDIWMPDTDGITLLKEWSTGGLLTMPVVMMSGHGTIETAVEATRFGALDYLEKPIALQRLLATVKRALRHTEMTAPAPLSLAMLGRSGTLAELKRRLAQLASSSAPLMLRGEAGIQPELFARYLVSAGAPFIRATDCLNDAPSDVLARAAGGILFIEECSALSRSDQKNLDFLLARAERNKVRIVSFSSQEPQRLIESGEFDAGLAQRLSTLVMSLPAVREFSEDVPDIATRMLAQMVESRLCAPRHLSSATLNALRQHAWPGNLQQLESIIQNLALTALDEEIQPSDLERVLLALRTPASAAGDLPLDQPYREARDAFERLYFEYQLARENGSVSRVAERSGIERTHLYRKLKALGLPAGKRDDN